MPVLSYKYHHNLQGHNEMRLANHVAILFLLLTANCVSAQNQSPSPLATLQAAYQAASDNLVSGFGTGSYEIYTAPSGKVSQQELKLKAKIKVFFDRGKFHIRFDYVKDDIHRLDSRIIIYDGTAILVSRISKHIHPAGSEGDIYEADPTPHTLKQACFDYNPCQLPASILRIDRLSDQKFASNLSISEDANKDYSGRYVYTPAPNHLRATFLATHPRDIISTLIACFSQIVTITYTKPAMLSGNKKRTFGMLKPLTRKTHRWGAAIPNDPFSSTRILNLTWKFLPHCLSLKPCL
jgi:hypothetical protein